MAKGKNGGKRLGAGRPKGARNKITAEANARLTELAQAYTEEMLGILVNLARGAESEAVRADCAQAVLDRGNGKPMQSHEHGNKDGEAFKIAPVINLFGRPE